MELSRDLVSYINMVNFICSKCGKLKLVIEIKYDNSRLDYFRLSIFSGNKYIDSYGAHCTEKNVYDCIKTFMGLVPSRDAWPVWAKYSCVFGASPYLRQKYAGLRDFNVEKFKTFRPAFEQAQTIDEFKLLCAAYGIAI